MPGKHYKFKVTRGPFEGEDVSIIDQRPDSLAMIVRVRRRGEYLFPLEWIEKKKGKKNGKAKKTAGNARTVLRSYRKARKIRRSVKRTSSSHAALCRRVAARKLRRRRNS